MSDPIEDLLGLIPDFRRAVVPPLDDRIAECVAIHWFIATANDSIDGASAANVARSLVPRLTAQPWSAWQDARGAFETRFVELCRLMIAGKQVTMAMGAGRASIEDLRILFCMNVAKCSLATIGRDDTDEALLTPLMHKLNELHQKAWPIVRTAGKPKPVAPPSAPQSSGCVVLLGAGLAAAVAVGGGTWLVFLSL